MSGAGQGVLTTRYNDASAALPRGAAATQMLGVLSATTVRPAISVVGGRRRRSRRSRRSSRNSRGGFYPSVMGPMARTGAYLIAPAFTNAYKLLTRKRRSKARGSKRQ